MLALRIAVFWGFFAIIKSVLLITILDTELPSFELQFRGKQSLV